MKRIVRNFERAARFKAIRLRLGFKKRPDVAGEIGVDHDTVKKWETGINRVPDYAFKALYRYEQAKKKPGRNRAK